MRGVVQPRRRRIRAVWAGSRAAASNGPVVTNQWAATFAQPAGFASGTFPPALQSLDVALTPANSVGTGTGTPTAGNWLVVLVGMSEQAAASGFTVGVKDDVHSYWRPGKVSTSAALTRTAAWYTPNTVRAPSMIYVAPNGAFTSMSVLVVELASAGPWDTLTVTPASNYAAAATSLALSLGAPSAQSFAIAAVTGDSATAGQAFAPAGWLALHTVSATNGTDHTCDCVLTSAFLGSNSGSLSVSASASSATDLSGVILELAVAGASPIPSAGQGQNPNWAYTVLEAAFGSGFETPEDQMTWTSLGDLGNSNVYRRFWAWDDTSGVPYALGQLQSGSGTVQADNADGLLSPLNPASLHYTSAAGWAPLAAFYDPLVTAVAPLGWWKLADASGSGTAADSSGNGHSGTATSVTFGSTSEAVSGNTSASFASASSSHVLTSYNPALGNSLTVEAWVNLNGLTQPTSFGRVIANSFSDFDSKGFELYHNGGQAQFWIGNGVTNNGVIGGTVPASGWTHLAGTYDGATIRLYVNGVQVGSTAFTGSVPAGSASGIGIGYNPAYAGDFINGLIAECAVYGTALTSQQIAAHYTAGPAGTGTPVRVRMALGTIAGTTYNRWYTWARNGLAWPERRNKALRGFVPVTLTDVWSVAGASCPTPVRGEIRQDSPYAWWPMDDAALGGGVLPSSLRNAATGNTNVLNIIVSPNGTGPDTAYATDGTSSGVYGYTKQVPVGLATYTVGSDSGWLYGDPQSSASSSATGNPVTASPGSAAWQTEGASGNTGTKGWFASCNDTGFPPLASGCTVEGWFKLPYFGTTATFSATGVRIIAQEPYAPISLLTLTTGSAPVAILQLDTSGHLSLITYNGTTPTSHSIYSSSDLRTGKFFQAQILLTTSTWRVLVNGGDTADVSGSGTSMTSAWSWIVVNGDMGNTSGGGTAANIRQGGNIEAYGLAVYPGLLPAWRLRAHYWAGICAFGQIPAPTSLALQFTSTISGANTTPTPDGVFATGTYGTNNTPFTYSALAVAQAGGFTSGPSAWVVNGSLGLSSVSNGYSVFVSWSGLATTFAVYTASSVGVETQAAITAGPSVDFSSGFGGSASSYGTGRTAGGSGASPPAAASSIGDTVAQRIERVLGYGGITAPNRAVDSTASALVRAAVDVGGQQTGASIQNLVDSDNGLLTVDNNNTLCYRSRAHLAADTVAWLIGMDVISGMIPFDASIEWSADPQKVWNAITATPYSPDGASLASYTPASAAGANASQAQFGARPRQVTSYLQDTTKIQAQATWLLNNFGILARRATVIAVDAATHPAAWGLVAGCNPGDLAQIYDAPLGQTATTGIYRVSQIRRSMSNGANGSTVQARLILTLDPVPSSYWQ